MTGEGVYNPATGERNFFRTTGAETNGRLLRFDWVLDPGGRVLDHSHPHQEARFQIHEGHLLFVIEGRKQVCGPGGSVVVPPGARHRFVNDRNDYARATIELRPALRFQELIESFAWLAREGRTSAAGAPSNPFELSLFAHEFWDEFRAARPPRLVQRLLLPPSAWLARRRGYSTQIPIDARAHGIDAELELLYSH